MSSGGDQKTVQEYLKELRQARTNKPDDVKEALDAYLGLWRDAIENGTVDEDEDIAEALLKLDRQGGLYEIARREEEKKEEEEQE